MASNVCSSRLDRAALLARLSRYLSDPHHSTPTKQSTTKTMPKKTLVDPSLVVVPVDLS
jgi:hypothetical protein